MLRAIFRITPLSLCLAFMSVDLSGAPAESSLNTVPEKIKVMLLTGQSNRYHNWSVSSAVLQKQLEESGRFAVTRVTTPPMGEDMSGFRPEFAPFAVVVLVYEGAEWPEMTKSAFIEYMKNGGGFVSFHDTDNAFPMWKEFNEMIGVGGWGLKPDGNLGARDESWGPKLRWRDGRIVRDESPGTANHPPKHDFQVVVRAPGHPVMQGIPAAWMHADDELYSQLRGPAVNIEVLATAFADNVRFPRASGEHEPVLMAIRYGKGRVFHTTLGHVGPNDTAAVTCLRCVGFTTTFLRGAEWAATGKVTIPVPQDFPTAESVSVRPPDG